MSLMLLNPNVNIVFISCDLSAEFHFVDHFLLINTHQSLFLRTSYTLEVIYNSPIVPYQVLLLISPLFNPSHQCAGLSFDPLLLCKTHFPSVSHGFHMSSTPCASRQTSGDIRLEVKCTINVMCLNYSEIIPHIDLWKNCLPQNWSLVPKRWGTPEFYMTKELQNFPSPAYTSLCHISTAYLTS